MHRVWLFLLAGTMGCAVAAVKVTRQTDRISVEIEGRPETALFVGPEATKPYLHPLRSASGKVVTRGFPMEPRTGETHDHPHHRGLWFSHGDVNGFDFWGNEPGQSPKGGRIVLNKVIKLESGTKSGEIQAVFDWIAPDGRKLLEESRQIVFLPENNLRTMDFDIVLKAVVPVVFGDTKEGTFAIRLAPGFVEPEPGQPPDPKRPGRMVNAEGATGEANVWGHRSAWVDREGIVDGEKLGIAIFDHPGNPRHPTYWHSRAYGLFAANPFGWHDFERDPHKNGSLSLPAGATLRFRYRVIIHSGDARAAGLAVRYAAYSTLK